MGTDTWTAKEVFQDLKQDILHRFDKTDAVLAGLGRRLGTMATKEDLRQIHSRVDEVEARIVPLEHDAANERALAESHRRFRGHVAWAAGVVAAAAMIAAVILPFVVH